MAGKNNRKSVQTGSDAVFDIMCTPCGEDGAREEAVQYCPRCQEYLCTACAKCHQRMRVARDHVLVGARQAKLNPRAASTAMEEKCWYHPDRNIEMYCGTHNMVYCTRCIATEHRSCCGITDIEHANKGNYSKDELQGLQSEISDIYEQLVNLSKKKEKIFAEIEEQKINIFGRIKDLKRKMVDHMEKLEKAATEVLKEKYSEVKKELDEDMSNVSKMIGKVEERKKKMSMVAHMDEGQRFVQVKLAQKTAADAKTLCKEKASKNHKVIKYTEEEELSDAVMKMQALCQVNIVEQQKELEIKTFDMETDDDECICLIADLCQIHDGTVLLVDQRNKKLKKLDKTYKAISITEFFSEPTGICCTEKNQVAVKLKSNRVAFFTLEDRGRWCLEDEEKCISIEDGGSWGMAYFAGDLWMSFRDGINVYSLSGDLKIVITAVEDPFGQVIQLSPVHLAVRKKSIFVANGRNGAFCLNKDGDLKFEIDDGRLRFTRGVSVTRRGNVFLSGSQSKNVVMFNKHGKYLREIVPANRMCDKGPVALLFDYTNNCLLIANNSSSNITVVVL